MSPQGQFAMKAIGLLLGVAIGLVLFGHVFLEDQARDKYRLYCRAPFTYEAVDVNGCDHEAREWHAPW